MARWAPGASGRLADAAIELSVEHGFRALTVADIAAHAGVTERTFYRHFATKEDVLFAEGQAILDLLLASIDAAPVAETPAEVLRRAIASLAKAFQTERSRHRNRANVIASDPALVERDLFKQYAWSQAIAARLHARGLELARATVVATAATAAFRTAFLGWTRDRSATLLVDRVNAALDHLVSDLTT
jgi:AcrR family transcriptional regulator